MVCISHVGHIPSQLMTIDQIIALSASLGAFLAAIATFLTVRQMIHQREASYRPELVISRTLFEGSQDPITKGLLPTHWVPKPDTAGESERSPLFSMPIVNVGLGAAKSLSIKWSFSIEEIIAQVNELAQRTLTPAHFELKNGVMSMKSESLGSSTSIWKNQQRASLDYVLPASVQKNSSFLTLPLAFIQLSSAYLFLAARDKDKKYTHKIPTLRANMEYFDIGGKHYSVNFDISLRIILFSGDGTFINGYLESAKHA